MTKGVGPRRAAGRKRRRNRRRVSVISVFGELLITAGVFVLLFLGWQLWLNDIIEGAAQAHQAQSLGAQFRHLHAATPTPTPSSTSTAGSNPAPSSAQPVVAVAPANARKFGILYIPRFGVGWERPIAQGIGVSDVLDSIGVGHYPGTAMPGQVGNFAIAAHRHAYGGAFQNLHTLHVGDHVYIGTKDGWYEYTFRDIQYVLPSEVNVLDPVPMQPGVKPVDRLITMTTCNPFYSTSERMIAYGVFDKWYPYAGGPPAEIAATVNGESS